MPLFQALKQRLPFYPKSRKVLVEGRIMEEGDIPRAKNGEFIRANSALPRTTKLPAMEVRPGRFTLFVCYGCPWAHRAALVHELMGFGLAVSLVHTEGWLPWTRGLPALATGGWRVAGEELALARTALRNAPAAVQAEAAGPDPLYVWQLYTATDPVYSGRVTVPVLWDGDEVKIVNNESSEVLRLLNQEMRALATPDAPDLYPAELAAEIDATNERLQTGFNNGVYRVGFAGSPTAYAEAKKALFETMDWMEERVATRAFLNGDRLTESDVRAFTTLMRFDSAYHMMFRATDRRLRTGYPHLFRYLRRLYARPPFRASCRGMLLGYPLMYSIICRWEGRRIANVLRLCEVGVFAVLRTLAPDAPDWRYRLASLCCLPLRALGRLVDPCPSSLFE